MIGMIRVMYRLFKKLFNKEVNEEFGYYEAGGYMKAQSDIARRLISRGMSLTEIVKTYMRRRDKNLTKLMSYAYQMRVAKIMTNYIEIQLY